MARDDRPEGPIRQQGVRANAPPLLWPVKRVVIIFLRAVLGIQSPSLGRRVRISDIWDKSYERKERDGW